MPTLAAELKRASVVLNRRVLTSLRAVIKAEVIPAIVGNIMSAYDSEMAGRAPAGDKASPQEPIAREAFEKIVRTSLSNTLTRAGSGVSVSAGNIDELKLNLEGSAAGLQAHLETVSRNPWVLDWLIFYLEGFGGEFAFISQDTYSRLVKAGAVIPKSDSDFRKWGWYQAGFMISKSAYEARGFGKIVPFATVRHPQSGIRPARIFERAMDGIDMKAVFAKALRVALGGT